ncbi:MAG: hypothetical protein EPO68_07485, partial [Planctomycetota bacterium]
MSLLRSVGRTSGAAACLGFAAGGVRGAIEYAFQRDYVREFQAGDPSPWSERLLAIAQRATFEGLGIGACALLAALAAALLVPLERWIGPRANGAAAAGPDTRFAASFVRASASFGLWIAFGGWLA